MSWQNLIFKSTRRILTNCISAKSIFEIKIQVLHCTVGQPNQQRSLKNHCNIGNAACEIFFKYTLGGYVVGKDSSCALK